MANILIVDDDPDVLDVLRVVLEEENHRAQTASTNEDAQRIIRAGDLDVIITDAVLQPLECQLSVPSSRKEVPLLVVSGDGDKVDDFRRAGIAALKKPFRPRALITMVDRLLDPSRSRVP